MSAIRPRLVGINHVALEVGDLEEALEFYGAIFELSGVDREPRMAFIDKAATRAALEKYGAEILPGSRLDFLDPWGNRIQVVDYRDIQFTKAAPVIRGMGLDHLRKRETAIDQLENKGLN
jgi:lactoylglutathione lyase